MTGKFGDILYWKLTIDLTSKHYILQKLNYVHEKVIKP